MSDTSNGDTSCSTANNNELDSNLNKKDSEKKRREQENLCIEELAMLISAQLPEFSDSGWFSVCSSTPIKQPWQ